MKLLIIVLAVTCGVASAQPQPRLIRLHVMNRDVLTSIRVTESNLSVSQDAVHKTIINDTLYQSLLNFSEECQKGSSSQYKGMDVRMFIELVDANLLSTLSFGKFDLVAINGQQLVKTDVSNIVMKLRGSIPPIFGWYESTATEREVYLQERRKQLIDSLDKQFVADSILSSQKKKRKRRN